ARRRRPRLQVARERTGALIRRPPQGVALQLLQQRVIGGGHVQPRLARVRDRAAERTDEEDSAQTDPLDQLEDGVAKRAPMQVRLLAQEESKTRRLVAIEGVARHIQGNDPAVLDLQVRTEQSIELHGAGKLEDVERFGVNLGEGRRPKNVY